MLQEKRETKVEKEKIQRRWLREEHVRLIIDNIVCLDWEVKKRCRKLKCQSFKGRTDGTGQEMNAAFFLEV